MRAQNWKELLNQAEKSHSKHSPSSLKYKEVCPHYQSDPEESNHPQTELGNRCHYALETDSVHIIQSEEELAFVQVALDFLKLVCGIKSEIKGDDIIWKDLAGFEMIRERRVRTEFEVCHGSSDMILLKNCPDGTREMHVIDWKFGEHYQGDADDNAQGQAYWQGAYREFGEPGKTHSSINFFYPVLETWTDYTIPKEQAQDHYEKYHARTAAILEKVMLAESGATLYNYDRENCQYCAHRTTCPAMNEMKKSFMLAHRNIMPAPKTFVIDNKCDAETVGLIVDAADILQTRGEQMRKEALQWAKTFKQNPVGYTVVQNRGKLTSTDHIGILDWAIDRGVKQDEFMESCVSVSVAQAVELVGRKVAETTGQTIKQSLADAREDLITEGLATVPEPFQYLRRVTKPKTVIEEKNITPALKVLPNPKGLNDNSPMPFGKYKGAAMKEVPSDYFNFLWNKGMNKQPVGESDVADYIRENLETLESENTDLIWR